MPTALRELIISAQVTVKNLEVSAEFSLSESDSEEWTRFENALEI